MNQPTQPDQVMPSNAKLASVLQRHGLISAQAINDPEGYDNYRTLHAVIDAARELRAMQYAKRMPLRTRQKSKESA